MGNQCCLTKRDHTENYDEPMVKMELSKKVFKAASFRNPP